MKKYGINMLSIFLVLVFLASCEDVIYKKEQNALDAETVWDDPSLANLYLNNIYPSILPGFAGTTNTDLSEEATGQGTGGMMYGNLTQTVDFGIYGVATFGNIRDLNVLIQDIETGSLSRSDINRIKGQAYFLRAYQYFQLIKYYGGVPLILEPQDPNDGDEALFKARSSASDCFEVVINDLDSAIAMLPLTYNDADYGRVTKAAAAAFKGRVMLFYASPQYDPNGMSNPDGISERWQLAYEANVQAKNICKQAGHGLYADFSKIFLNEDNIEAIFITKYDGAIKSHGYDNTVRPSSVSNTGETKSNPSWDMVEAFPMKDGSTITESTDYDEEVYWKDRDPRFYATIGYNSVEWLFPERQDQYTRQWTYVGNEQEGNANSGTGFYVRKNVNTDIEKTKTQQVGTDWIEIRFAEVLLNLAECANEVGSQSEAFTELYEIRKRAGIEPGTSSNYGISTSLSKAEMRDFIMKERLIEMAYENKRHWDLRRRNMYANGADGVSGNGFNGQQRTIIETTVDTAYIKSLYPDINNASTESPNDSAFYVFEEYLRDTIDWENPSNYSAFFNTKFYIESTPINYLQPKYNFYYVGVVLAGNTNALDRNPELEETILWDGGTFDPLDE